MKIIDYLREWKYQRSFNWVQDGSRINAYKVVTKYPCGAHIFTGYAYPEVNIKTCERRWRWRKLFCERLPLSDFDENGCIGKYDGVPLSEDDRVVGNSSNKRYGDPTPVMERDP